MASDYYKMLGVDRRADRDAIEAALLAKQPEWSAGTRNPKNKHTFQSYLDQIPQIRRSLLGAPLARAAYDAELTAEEEIAKRGRLEALSRLVKLRAAKGGLTVSDRRSLRTEAGKLALEPADLDLMIEAIPPLPETPRDAPAATADADVLDATLRKQIRAALEHIQKRDLYEALDLPRDAPPRALAEEADAIRKRWMKKSQVTAEKTAWLEAVSFAQSHLTHPEARARYDRTLATEAEERFERALAFALDGARRLDSGTRAAVLEEAELTGVVHERAEELLNQACRERGIRFDELMPGEFALPNGVAKRTLRCRRCGALADHAHANRDPNRPACSACGEPLRWACPACRRKNWIDETRCGCGFRLELREPLVKHFEAGQHAYKIRDLESALYHLERVQYYAPFHVGGRKGLEIVRTQLAEVDRIKRDAEAAAAGKRVVEALALIQKWARLVEPGDPRVRTARIEVGKLLRDARILAARGADLITADPPQARALLRKSLSIASDLQEARQALDLCPPDPPAKLTVEVREGAVRLDWSPAAADGLASPLYCIFRKRRSAPEAPGDGDYAGETTGTNWIDRGAEPGEIYGYAVSSRRGTIDSLSVATAGPIGFFPEVRNLQAEARTGEVDLSWTLPQGAFGARVVRKAGGLPTGPGDGESIPCELDKAADRGLADNRTWHYAVFAQYRLHDGSTRTAKAVFASIAQGAQGALPTVSIAAPSPQANRSMAAGIPDPTELRAERAGTTSRINLRWNWPAGTDACLVVAVPSGREPRPEEPCAHSEVVTRTDYDRAGQWVLDPAGSDEGRRIRVYSVTIVDRTRVLSPGTEPTAAAQITAKNEIAVTYRLKKPWLPRKRWTLEFRTDPPGATIPPTLLVANPRAVPLSVDDGELVARFMTAVDGSRLVIESDFDLARGRSRLFTDPSLANGHPPVRLVSTDSAETRV